MAGKANQSHIAVLGIALILTAGTAAAELQWRMEFNDPPSLITPTDTVVVTAKLINSGASTEDLGVIGGFQGQPPGFDYEVGAFASIPNPTPIEYEFQFGPAFVGNVPGAFSDQFEGVDLMPGESFEFVYMMFRPKATDVAIGSYSFFGELQLFVASPPIRPLVGSSEDRLSWIVQDVTRLEIDIKPGGDPNSINPSSGSKIPVAILTTDTFDATQVDWESVLFGPGRATESHGRAHIKDVDDDGDMDLLLHFNTAETGIACGDTEATLTGETFDGQAILGTDSIVTVKCD